MKFLIFDRMNLGFLMAAFASLVLVSSGNQTVAPSISPSPNRGSSYLSPAINAIATKEPSSSPSPAQSKSKLSKKGSKSKSKTAFNQASSKGKSKGFSVYNSTNQVQGYWGNGVMMTQKNVTVMAAAVSAGFTMSSKQIVILFGTVAATTIMAIAHIFG
jgi:hypothetical protein